MTHVSDQDFGVGQPLMTSQKGNGKHTQIWAF